MQTALNNTPDGKAPSSALISEAKTGILAREKTQAVQQLIKLTRNLADLAERESQALAQNDMLGFAILQDEKALIAEHYAAASNEFRARLPEFRGMNPALLDKLESLQHRLGEAARQNNDTVSRVYAQSKENTQNTLLSAQELGQSRPVQFANDAQHEEVKNA
ncbi:MAG: hypothetical protein AB8B83_00675 [Bdellovibrionales bacterium]